MYEPLKGHDCTWLKARQEIPGITLVSAIKTSNRLCVWLSHWVGHQHHLLCVNNSFLWCISSTDPLKLYIRQSHFQIFKNKDNNNKDHDLIRILDAMKSFFWKCRCQTHFVSSGFETPPKGLKGYRGCSHTVVHSKSLFLPFLLLLSPPLLQSFHSTTLRPPRWTLDHQCW